MLTLYQAEWCPYSHRVRQRLTELMVPFVARPVEPDPDDRDELRRVSGDDAIPVLVTESGQAIADADRIIEWLDANYAEPAEARRHRAQARKQRMFA
ncbi:MAG: glutaredoxin family protein [Gaiellaceae bacterium]